MATTPISSNTPRPLMARVFMIFPLLLVDLIRQDDVRAAPPPAIASNRDRVVRAGHHRRGDVQDPNLAAAQAGQLESLPVYGDPEGPQSRAAVGQRQPVL